MFIKDYHQSSSAAQSTREAAKLKVISTERQVTPGQQSTLKTMGHPCWVEEGLMYPIRPALRAHRYIPLGQVLLRGP
jgi:hypothetical protein